MKNSTKFLSFAKLYQDFYKSDKLVSLSNSYELLVLLKRLGWRLISLALMGFNRNLSARCSQVYRFGKYLLLMRKRHGDIYTVKYLKACQLAVQKRIALDQIKSLRDLEPDLPLPRLSTSRLPRFIPLEDRRSICAGSPNIIRY